MKNHIFPCVLLVLFLAELAILFLFLLPDTESPQDAVAANEAVQTVQRDWASLERHENHTGLDYVVLGTNGAVLYRTKPGLSESLNAAIRHKDTILDIQVQGAPAGKLIIDNKDALLFQSKKQAALFAMIAVILLQGGICAGNFFYIRHTVISPFRQLKKFAERIAGGNLDIPLEMDRQNLFGAFTESFDMMRSELKKARISEAKANASKKELAAKLSHDIRTPVASIKAASEVGAALSPDGKNKENYRQIIQKADQINTLVTNLFSAALEELQELPVTPSILKSKDLQVLLENADYLHRAAIPAIPACLLYADRLRLQQVFDNIFSNSYKYADTNIHITICMDEGGLAVCIEDCGGGVSAPELSLLKEKFMRGSNTKKKEGAGLGLYIADYCMKKMQGRLDVENGQDGLKVTVFVALASTI